MPRCPYFGTIARLPRTRMTKLVDNERVKLLAGALDPRLYTTVFTAGIVKPVVSYFFNLQNVRDTLGSEGLAPGTSLHRWAGRPCPPPVGGVI